MAWGRSLSKRRGLGSSIGARAERPTPRTVLPSRTRGYAAPLTYEAKLAELMVAAFDRLGERLSVDDVLGELVSGNYGALLDQVDWTEWESETVRSVLDVIKDSIETEGHKTFTEVQNGTQALTADQVRQGVYGTSPPQVPPQGPGVPSAPSPRSGGFYGQVRFDMTNPFAVAYAESAAANLVREVGRNTRRAIQDAVVESFREGVSVDDLSRSLRQTIGLTRRQARAVENFRQRLIDGGTDIERADVLTRRYWRKTRNRRAQTIARTEIMRASNYGRAQAWLSAADHGLVDANASVKEWVTAPENSSYGPPCPVCLPMDGVKVTGAESLFDLPGGKQMSMPPAHPNCRCTAVLWPPPIPEDFVAEDWITEIQ